VLKYLNGTKHLKLKLSIGDFGLLKWYVNRSHSVIGIARDTGE
jgi:hypothetical protein